MLGRRARAQRALLGLVAVLVAVAAGVLAGAFGVVRAGAEAAPAAARPAVVAGAGVPVALLTLAALVTLAQVGSLLGQERQAETELLLSRGAAPAQVTAAALAESAAVCAGGTLVGTVAAWAALAVTDRPADLGILAVVGAAVAVAAALLLAGTTALRARAAARRAVSDRSGRVRQVATGGLVTLTFAAAALCLVQLLRYGSPLVVAADGTTRTDPLAAGAPALVLASLAVVALGVLGPVARLVERWAARRPGLGVVTVRQVARRLVSSAVPLVLVVLAGGSAAFAGVYGGAAGRMATDVGVLTTGADLRVVRENPPALNTGASPDADAVAAVAGIAAAVPALRLETSAQQVKPTLVAVPAAATAGVVRATRAADAATLTAGLRGEDDPFHDAPRLPAGTTALEARVTASATVLQTAPLDVPPAGGVYHVPSRPTEPVPMDEEGVGFPAVTLWLARADGVLVPLRLGAFDADLDGDGDGTRPVGPHPTPYTVRAELPALGEGWLLAAMDVDVSGAEQPLHLTLSIDGLSAQVDGGSVPVDVSAPWASALGDVGAGRQPVSGLAVDLITQDSGRQRLRVEPTGQGQAPIPAVVTKALADELGLATGDLVDMSAQGLRIGLRVAGVVDAVPGALRPHVAMVDLARLNALLLRAGVQVPGPGEVWATVDAAADARATAARVADAMPGTTVLTPATSAPGADASGPVRAATWIAATGVVALAILGVGVTAAAGLRARRGEVVVLRAVGVGPRTQGRARAVELGAVATGAVVVGLAGGWALGTVAVPGLVRSTVTGVAQVPPTVLAWAVVPTALLAAALLLGVVAVSAAMGVRVRAQARDTAFREEVR